MLEAVLSATVVAVQCGDTESFIPLLDLLNQKSVKYPSFSKHPSKWLAGAMMCGHLDLVKLW
jgi:hypothetical protein